MNYPLRIVIPLLLLAATAIISAYNLNIGYKHEEQHIEQHAREDIEKYAAVIRRFIQLATNETLQQHLNIILDFVKDTATLEQFLIIDEDQRIMASIHAHQKGKETYEVLPADNPMLTRAINLELDHHSTNIDQQVFHINPQRQAITGLFPITINTANKTTLRGWVYISKDLNVAKTLAYSQLKKRVLQTNLVMIALALSMWILSHFLVSRRMTRLLDTTRQIAAGNLLARAQLKGRDELGTIGEAVDNMAIDLGFSIASLSDREAEIRLLLDSTAEGIFSLDLQGQCMMTNRACLELLGYTQSSDFVGKNMHQLIHHSHNNGKEHSIDACPIRQALTHGKKTHSDSDVFWHKGGTPIAVEYWSHPIKKDNALIGIVVTFLDISARRETEKNLQRHQNDLENLIANRTKKLQAANKELKAFSYSVSHDLKAPLRSISGFSQAILEEFEHTLDPSAKDYLLRINAAANRMNELIHDMLKLSRVTSGKMNITHVNLSYLAQYVIENLKPHHPDMNIRYTIQPKLSANGDERLLKIILENLFDNACKFSGKASQTQVTFGCLDKDTSDKPLANPVFFICDNGVGFDTDFSDKLFKPFQRLHHEDEFSGTGIGLATVQRIVERHNGQIWADSTLDQGACFYFTLGKEETTPTTLGETPENKLIAYKNTHALQ